MRTFQNPVKYIDGKPHTNPDPYVMKWCGKYYCYSTNERGVSISESEDLTLWEHKGYAICEPEYQNYWAPAVLYHNGLFYMYYSNETAGETELHREFLKLAVSASPTGPFVHTKTFFDKFSIDAHPVVWNGEVYLFYSTNDIAGNADKYAGTCILVDRLVEMDVLAGSPVAAVTPSLPEEIYCANRFGDGRDWHTIEGASFVEKQDKCYLLYSANAYVNETYYVGFASADKKKSFLDMKWEKYPDRYTFHPLLHGNSAVEGTGHNTVARAPNLVDDWIIYHGRDALTPIIKGAEQRVMRMDPMYCNGECLITNGPSSDYQDAPSLPEIKIEYSQIQAVRLVCDAGNFYIAEASIKPRISPDGAKYGVLLNYCDEANYIEAQFHSGLNSVTIIVREHGIRYELSTTALSKDYNHFVVHCIGMHKQYDRYTLEIDFEYSIQFQCSMPNGEIGFIPHYTMLEVWGFAKTAHCSLWKKDLLYLNRIYSIEPGALLDQKGLVPGGSGSIKLVREEFAEHDYTEEFLFEAMGTDNEITVVFCCEDTSRHEQVSLTGMKGSFNVRYAWFQGKGWSLSDGTVKIFPSGYSRVTSVEIKLKNIRTTGYQQTGRTQKCYVKSKNV